MAKTTSGRDILAKFFDDGAYQVLCGEQGAVTAAFGSSERHTRVCGVPERRGHQAKKILIKW